ncbi:hypothetical protein C8F04DRAFT_1403666 [Mycena alexandri]|uniref:Uncharacterized protein n=1 Tax=Mycena alexandri TaxID=1745969 RepID=A0AAD6WTI0_9AGAR|nr:hypothetical protein C8F04DRAFT_1403666 [Mycena alexandri]
MFILGGNVELVGGIAFHAESLHPGHHRIAQDPLQYPLTFNFDDNVERVGGIAFRPEFVHSALHGLVYNTLRYPLTFIWDSHVGCVGGVAASIGSSMTPHDIPHGHLGWQRRGRRGVAVSACLTHHPFPPFFSSLNNSFRAFMRSLRPLVVWCSIPALVCGAGAKSPQRSLSKYPGVALRANSGLISDLRCLFRVASCSAADGW